MIAAVLARVFTAWVLWRAWRDRDHREPDFAAYMADRVLERLLAEMPPEFRTDPDGILYGFMQPMAEEMARMYELIELDVPPMSSVWVK